MIEGAFKVDHTGFRFARPRSADTPIVTAGPPSVNRPHRPRLERVPDTKCQTLYDFIARTVKDEAEAIYTDELASYLGIAADDTRHETVNHSAENGLWVMFTPSVALLTLSS